MRLGQKKHRIFSSLLICIPPAAEPVTESEPQITEITAEEKTETAPPTTPKSHTISKPAPASTEPKQGDRTVIHVEPHVWIPGLGWIKDEGGGSVGTMVGNPGDQLTGTRSVSWEEVQPLTAKVTSISRSG